MSDTENNNKTNELNETDAEKAFSAGGVSDEPIDEELLALSAPPPSPQHAVFILIILGFSCLVLYLFWPELKYFMKGFADPTDLGEAADLEFRKLASDSFVKVEGVPLVNRTVTFSTGTKWFSGDIYRKMAPLSGNPNLLVQWHTHNPNIKQAKDALTPPSDFAGRLKKRTDLSENYNKFWPFYDCLKLHNTSQCKFCIGKKDLDECRPIFTCVDNYPIEVCDHTAFFTKEQVTEKIQKLKKDLQSRGSADLAAELEINEKALAAFENIDILSDFTLLEELFDRVAQLTLSGEAKAKAFALQKKIFDFQMQALEIRLRMPLEKINGLSRALKSKLEQAQAQQTSAEKKIAELERIRSKLSPLVDINTELAEFVTMVREQQDKLRRFDDSGEALKNWTLTGKESGAELLAKVRNLAALIATLKVKPKPKTTAADARDTDEEDASSAAPDVQATQATDNSQQLAQTANEATAADTPPTEKSDTAQNDAPKNSEHAALEQSDAARPPLEDPVLAEVDKYLNDAVERVAVLGRKLILVSPGDVPELDAWAANTDIVGSLPKPLRADHVFSSFETLLKMLASFTPHETESLKARYKNVVAQLKTYRKTAKDLSATSGLAELSLVNQFTALKKQQAGVTGDASLQAAVAEWRALTGRFAGKEFYPWDLSNFPKEKAALGQLVKQVNTAALEGEVKQLEAQYASPMYVLLDDEKPTDNPWILFVYIVVPIMLLINIRKLLRFIADWRQ